MDTSQRGFYFEGVDGDMALPEQEIQFDDDK